MKRIFFRSLVFLTVIVSCIALLFNLFDNRWVERQEIFGIMLGMDKRAVLTALSPQGITEFLPVPVKEITIDGSNIDEIDQLKTDEGICVHDFKSARSLQVSFDTSGNIARFIEPSVKKFTNLSGVKTREDLFLKLRPLIKNESGILVFQCFPGEGWKKIPSDDIKSLLKYDSWIFLEPQGYSEVRLFFENDNLAKIKYRHWQHEPW